MFFKIMVAFSENLNFIARNSKSFIQYLTNRKVELIFPMYVLKLCQIKKGQTFVFESLFYSRQLIKIQKKD